MSTFSSFPPEIREMVWNAALYHEARSRFVVLQSHQRPFLYKYLCSPLLSLNWESRQYALEFYSIKVKVFHAKSPRTEEERFALRDQFAPEPEDDSPGSERGVIYLSPEADNFIADPHVGIESWFGNGVPRERVDICVADALTAEDCAKVQNLFHPWDFWKTIFGSHRLIPYFPSVKRHRTIWFGHNGWCNRIAKLYELPYLVKHLRQSTLPATFIDQIADDAEESYSLFEYPRVGPPQIMADRSRSVEYCKWFLIMTAANDEAMWMASYLPLPPSAKIRLLQGFDEEARRWCEEHQAQYKKLGIFN
ncbi:hypothetical protein GGR53DRAFT_462342 [Hypoxylon sp. FL1150]|nr:hypothetical protein GGR53DRAFT_462342 [Hypoxylon sp. FL1150]